MVFAHGDDYVSAGPTDQLHWRNVESEGEVHSEESDAN